MPSAPDQRDRGVVADDLRDDLLHGLGHDRVHLPGHDRRSRLEIGDVDLREPCVRSAPHPPDVSGDLVERDRDHATDTRGLDERVARALGLEVIAGLGEWQLHVGGDLRDGALREPTRAVDAGADRGAAEGQLADARQHRDDPLDAVLDGLCVAAELLAERDGSGVHQMRAAGLDHCLEAALLAPQLLREVLERGDQVA